MLKKMKKKSWTVMISSGPQSSIKQFKFQRLFVYSVIGLATIVIVSFGMLTIAYDNLRIENTALTNDLDEREEEIAKLNNENHAIYEEATAVQETVEEFKQIEELLNDLDLDLPSGTIEEDGSGGLEFEENPDISSLNQDIHSDLIAIHSELPELLDDFESTVDALVAYEEQLRTVPTHFPAAEGRISSEFGNRNDPFTGAKRFHSGTDVAAPLDTEIYAAADGVVTEAVREDGYGNKIVISHGDTYETLYAHLNSMDVSVGDEVKKGDFIGGMGTTGRSTGVHLHYEIRRYGELIDPYKYMTFHQQENDIDEDES
ncbi:peptidoglycan DD-metalloendopeptidase family protein [Salipaludibacillus agaradhaerens]|uniref:Peptidoglycan DD-metalloendopeptidase family protein n=1 Tax=Salipaludibacillus agaradhaerens TaxID=76935 RepID=A0A9Q4FYR7_SALAG|nr:peptidoglycan DD-metalloendopeptidase family protein [Salipaludibacillus agaradhaerens]MCR6096407.1 peptidoglycan DD-metalloendopeptidase family protein [Salipaludibacillus agaradhaerens]MCR6114034.1 peptidoglycan DD-metalloendopeptidase family protein [Salipaludibacillus agaradhaerens]